MRLLLFVLFICSRKCVSSVSATTRRIGQHAGFVAPVDVNGSHVLRIAGVLL